MSTYPLSLLVITLQIPLTIGNLILVVRQILGIVSNVTTNELIGRKKYLYLRDEQNNFHNSFDRGCAANCHQYWCVPNPDWAAIFEEDRQVCLNDTHIHHILILVYLQVSTPDNDVCSSTIMWVFNLHVFCCNSDDYYCISKGHWFRCFLKTIRMAVKMCDLPMHPLYLIWFLD